jgi:phospholipid/cholesterol/gamma-HCH transport system permease protein
MGINPVSYLVTPKLIAMILMMPALTIFADCVGILGGAVISVTLLQIHPYAYLNQTVEALLVRDVTTGLIKSISFGVSITIVGVYQGFKVTGGAEEVGMRTTASVVSSIFMIILLDLFFTILFYFLT